MVKKLILIVLSPGALALANAPAPAPKLLTTVTMSPAQPAGPSATNPDAAPPAPPAHAETPADSSTPAASAPAHAADAAPEHAPATPGGTTKEELAGLLRIGQRKLEQGDLASAELAFNKILVERASPEQDHDALLGLAKMYKKRGDFTKAAAISEKFIKLYPNDVLLPNVYLDLGRILRNMGAYKQAVARFYNVINSTLKLPEDGSDTYRQLARTAQFEIAETYFVSGDYEQAGRFFSRLRLLDLAPEDRARAHFKSAYSLILDKDQERAVVSLKSFLELYPADDNAPEARYLLSFAFYRMGRFQEALAAAVELLKTERAVIEKNPRRWAYWQRKTGNQLANEFYENGSFKSALQIYLSLDELATDPIWKLTVAYQVGLCHERLLQLDQADTVYQSILERAKTSELDTNQTIEANDLVQMTQWRLKHIAWQTQTDKTIVEVFSTAQPTAAKPPALLAPLTADRPPPPPQIQ